jgi:hypothetical protein
MDRKNLGVVSDLVDALLLQGTRAVNPRCEICLYFEADRGECRRHAPTTTAAWSSTFWPKVSKNDWCGEFTMLEQEFEMTEPVAV